MSTRLTPDWVGRSNALRMLENVVAYATREGKTNFICAIDDARHLLDLIHDRVAFATTRAAPQLSSDVTTARGYARPATSRAGSSGPSSTP